MSGEERAQADEMLSELRKAMVEKNKSEIERNIEDFENEFWIADLTSNQLDYINCVINDAREILNNTNHGNS